MTAEAESPSCNFGLDSIQYLALTDSKEDVLTFRWEIKNFKRQFQNSQIKFELKSPVFDFKKPSRSQWQLKISGKKRNDEEESLSAYLHLKDGPNPTLANFKLNIINDDKSVQEYSSGAHHYNPAGEGFGWEKYVKTAKLNDPESKMLENGTLKLCCRIFVQDEAKHQIFHGVTNETALKRKEDMISDFRDLFISSDLSDVTLQTETEVLRAHKAILSCRSSVFKAMFSNEMLESTTNTVKIPDFDHEVVYAMLQYIYCGDALQEIFKEKSFEMLEIADKYNVKGLKEQMEEIIATSLTIENVAHSLTIADMHNALYLKDMAVKYFNMNRTEVVKTEGFQKLSKSLLMDLYNSE